MSEEELGAQGTLVQEFVTDLLDAFGLDGSVSIATAADEAVDGALPSLPPCFRPPLPPRPPGLPPLGRRSRRSAFGRGWVGFTRARTRASPRVRPKRPVRGSSRTSNSASCSSTPS